MEVDRTELGTGGAEVAAAEDSEGHQAGRAKEWLREIIETLLLAAIIWAVVNLTTARFVVDGPSMEPNLHTGEFVVVSRIAYWKWVGKPQRGDIVVLHPPTNPGEEWIKRVIGLPGDTVEIREGKVYINQQELPEPYLSMPTASSGVWRLGEDEYFVMGDNRSDSQDSRSWGRNQLKSDMLIGKAWLVYWPPREWGPVPHQTYAAIPERSTGPDRASSPPTPTLTSVPRTVQVPGESGDGTAGAQRVPGESGSGAGGAQQEPVTPQPGWVGSRVVVSGTGGVGLAVREGPGVDYKALFVAQEGAVYVVEGGPRQGDGYTWWYIADPDEPGNEGWAAQSYMERVLGAGLAKRALA